MPTLKCGFCGEPDISTIYNKPTEWASCKRCRNFVDRGEYKVLLNVMTFRWIATYPEDRRVQGIHFIKQINKKIISVFMAARGVLPFN